MNCRRDLETLLLRYYKQEANALPRWARIHYGVRRRVDLNLNALESRKIFPFSFIERETNLHICRILDAGCGTGHSSITFAQACACLIGIDIDNIALKIAQYRARAEGVEADFQKGDITCLQFRDNSFNVVLCHQVLEHLAPEEQVVALKEMWRVLASGGILFIQTPNRWFPIDVHDSLLPFVHWLPESCGHRIARAARRIPPIVHPMTWIEIASSLGLSKDGSTLINKYDMYHDRDDFRTNQKPYTSDLSWRLYAYNAFSPALYFFSRLWGLPFAAFAPNLNLLIRKQHDQLSPNLPTIT